MEDGYFIDAHYADSALDGIAEEAIEKCSLGDDEFVVVKYHGNAPGAVDNGFYTFVTTLGLALAIIQFLIGLSFSCWAKKVGDQEANMADVVANNTQTSGIEI